MDRIRENALRLAHSLERHADLQTISALAHDLNYNKSQLETDIRALVTFIENYEQNLRPETQDWRDDFSPALRAQIEKWGDPGQNERPKDKLEIPFHMQELYENWSAETNDPETQKWRDDLSSEELAQVEKWDDSFQEGFQEMAQDIILQGENHTEQKTRERQFITRKTWDSQVYPQNVDELVAAFNRSMNDYIQAADLHPEIAEDEIQKKADQLWLHYCKTGEIDGVQAQWQAEPELSKPPVARIDFLSSSGRVGDSMEYTDLQDFERELTRETYYGVPMSVVLYKNADGSVPPHQFVFELDPPPKGFAVADNPYIAQQDGLCQNSIDIGQEIDAVDYEMEM